MSIEQKDLYIKIKRSVTKKRYDEAMDLCDDYCAIYPDDLNGWLYYILAYCEVPTLNDLIKQKINLKDVSVYENAIEVLQGADRQKLINIANKIESGIVNANKIFSYSDCLKYFTSIINSLKVQADNFKAEVDAKIQEDKKHFANVSKLSAKFYGNNVFTFILFAAMLSVPFVILYVFLGLLQANKIVPLIPIIIYGILVIVISVSKLKRLIFYRKWKLDLKTTALSNEDDIIKAQLEYAFMVSKRKKLLRIYKNLKKRKSLSSKGVLKFKSKFDAIYNQTMAE